MAYEQQLVRRLVRLEGDLSELLSMETLGRHTISESASPDSASDDSTAGFTIGSLWYRSGSVYTCTDSTAGAAVWTNITDGAGAGNSLAGLSDTDVTPLSACDILIYDSVATNWTACTHNLANITGVDNSIAPAASDVLLYNSVSGSWVASAMNTTNIADIDVSGATACDTLLYDSVAGAWTACNTASDVDVNRPAVLRADSNGNFSASVIGIAEQLFHVGDTDTFWEFTTDKISASVGGVNMLNMTNTGQDVVEIGDVVGTGDVDINFNNGQMFLQGSDGALAVGHVAPAYTVDVRATTAQIGASGTAAQLLLDADQNAQIIIDRGDAAQRGEIAYRTDTVAKWYAGLTDSDSAGVDGTEFYIGQTSGGAGGDFVILTDGKVGINTTAPDYDLDVGGDIGLNQYLYHNADPDTVLEFTPDMITACAGGVPMLVLTEAATDTVQILPSGGSTMINTSTADLNRDVTIEQSTDSGANNVNRALSFRNADGDMFSHIGYRRRNTGADSYWFEIVAASPTLTSEAISLVMGTEAASGQVLIAAGIDPGSDGANASAIITMGGTNGHVDIDYAESQVYLDSASVTITASDVLMLRASGQAGAQDSLELGDVAGGGDVDIDFNNGQAFLRGSDGFLNIGNTAPDTILHTEEDKNSFSYVLFENVNTGTGADAGLRIQAYDTSAAAQYFWELRNDVNRANDFQIRDNANNIRVTLDENGTFFIGDENVNTNMTVGLTINQGANDDELFAAKSSDIGHAFTNVTEADSYMVLDKVNAAEGGGRLTGYRAENTADTALGLRGYISGTGTVSTTKSVSGTGVVDILSASDNSNSASTINTSDANIVSMRNHNQTRWILDAEGDTHYDGTDGAGAWDDYNDIELLGTFRALTTKRDIAKKYFGEWLSASRNAQILHNTGVITMNDDGHHFVSTKGLNGLMIDAMRQLHHRIAKLEAQSYDI